jgi:uncharacterized protein YbjQ (UPF0145 family)
MKLFGNSGDGLSQEAVARADASIANIERGGLPLNAIDRLQEEASKQGTPQQFFTSDLSVNELLLTRQCGYEPLGQVMGSTIYHLGFVNLPNWSWQSGEIGVLTEAYYNARHLAMNRLRQEAMLLKADGILGVRLTRTEYSWGSGMLEFMAVGTAVRRIGAPPTVNADPFLSALNGQDHFALRKAGMKPVGFCMGNCTWFQSPNWQTYNATTSGFLGGGWNNVELTDFTQAFYTARELAMSRMEAEAAHVGAQGVVGVVIEPWIEKVETGSDSNRRVNLIVHFTAIGTAVSDDDSGEPFNPSVMPILPIG